MQPNPFLRAGKTIFGRDRAALDERAGRSNECPVGSLLRMGHSNFRVAVTEVPSLGVSASQQNPYFWHVERRARSWRSACRAQSPSRVVRSRPRAAGCRDVSLVSGHGHRPSSSRCSQMDRPGGLECRSHRRVDSALSRSRKSPCRSPCGSSWTYRPSCRIRGR